jgi:hypothetical protein
LCRSWIGRTERVCTQDTKGLRKLSRASLQDSKMDVSRKEGRKETSVFSYRRVTFSSLTVSQPRCMLVCMLIYSSSSEIASLKTQTRRNRRVRKLEAKPAA